MTREEIKARDNFEKTENSYRKQVSKKYGWKQRGYINWKIVSDYFFCLYHLTLEDAYLKVKPLFVDDLWWDIFEMSENIQAPKSLRGDGAFAIDGIRLKEYIVFNANKISEYSEEEISNHWDDMFKQIEKDTFDFIEENPNPDLFSPSNGQKYGKVSPEYTLMMDIHSGKLEEALTKIEYFKSNDIKSGFSGPKGDAYKYIALWCKKKNSNLSQSFLKRIRKWFP